MAGGGPGGGGGAGGALDPCVARTCTLDEGLFIATFDAACEVEEFCERGEGAASIADGSLLLPGAPGTGFWDVQVLPYGLFKRVETTDFAVLVRLERLNGIPSEIGDDEGFKVAGIAVRDPDASYGPGIDNDDETWLKLDYGFRSVDHGVIVGQDLPGTPAQHLFTNQPGTADATTPVWLFVCRVADGFEVGADIGNGFEPLFEQPFTVPSLDQHVEVGLWAGSFDADRAGISAEVSWVGYAVGDLPDCASAHTVLRSSFDGG